MLEKNLHFVEKTHEAEGEITLSNQIVKYRFWIPSRDEDSEFRTLKDPFGHYMVFHNIGNRVSDFLKEKLEGAEIRENNEYFKEDGGFGIRIRIEEVKKYWSKEFIDDDLSNW